MAIRNTKSGLQKMFEKGENMTERDIQIALYRHYYQQSKIFIPNSNAFGWEADMLMIMPSLRVHEFEIKISRADFKKDAEKYKHQHINDKLNGVENRSHNYWTTIQVNTITPANHFWYAVPEGLVKLEELPRYAGLIFVRQSINYPNLYEIQLVKKAPLLHKEKLSVEKQIQIMRRLSYRYFNLKYKPFGEQNDIDL
jgi:hypothetical protein